MLEILERISKGEGEMEDLNTLLSLAEVIRDASLCNLGKTSVNPVLSTLEYFRDEYEAHIKEKKCPAHVCSALITYRIDPTICNGCTACERVCPAGAITGEKKKVHVINPLLCTKCGSCFERCRFGAVIKD